MSPRTSAFLVGDGGVERRDEDVALDGLVEPGRLDDLVVGGASGESDAEPVPGHLADVDHLVDVVSHVEPRCEHSPSPA